jgi:hypothetical protein
MGLKARGFWHAKHSTFFSLALFISAAFGVTRFVFKKQVIVTDGVYMVRNSFPVRA